MKISRLALARGVGWTVAGYGASQLMRLLAIVVIARLLAPELFGIMTIINSLRTGLDLVSDVGIGQNIVQNKNADNPDFYNTAWTLQLIRGPLIYLVCLAGILPMAHLYDAPILLYVLPVAALFFIMTGFTSISVFLLQRRLQLAKLNIFETTVEIFSALSHIVLAYFSPTVWALVLGGLSGSAFRMIGSYLLLPELRHHFLISKQYAWQIFSFGKWIFISSIVYFVSMNFDRLYLGKVAPLATLGIYGIARSLSDPIGALILRLGSFVIFPVIASSTGLPRDQLRSKIAPNRLKLLLVAALALALFASITDWVVAILYDHRYQSAAWMLPILIFGVWLSIICSINEASLMGFGKPFYGAVASTLKCGYILIALPFGYMHYGILGAVVVMAASDLCRYIPLLVGLFRERCAFGKQDLLATIILLALIGSLEWLRSTLGFGVSFESLLIDGPH